MKKHWIVFLLIGFILVPAGCSSNSTSASPKNEKIIIRMANAVSDDNFVNDGYRKFKEIIEKESDGRVEVQIFSGGTLAASDAMNIELLESGAVEIASIAPYGFSSSSSVTSFNIFEFPFLFSNRDEFYEFVDGPYGQKLEEDILQQTKLKQLGIFDLGFYSISNSKKPVLEPKDLKGLKIRSTSAPMHIDTLAKLGANPTPIAYGETFTALQQGTVDGLMLTTPLIYSDKFYEVTPYLTVTNHVIIPHALQINREFFEGLPTDIQELVTKAANEQVQFTRELVAQVEEEAIQKLGEEGVEINQPTPEEIKKFEQELQSLIEESIPLVGEENYSFALEQLENNKK